jgi:hypothetical protein
MAAVYSLFIWWVSLSQRLQASNVLKLWSTEKSIKSAEDGTRCQNTSTLLSTALLCVCVVHTLILTEACLCKVLSQRMIQVSCFRGHSSSGGGHGNSGEDWAGRNCFRLTAIWVERVLCYLSCLVIKSSSIWLVHLLFNSGPDLTSILYALPCTLHVLPISFPLVSWS